MTRFPFAHYARLLHEQWQRDLFASRARQQRSSDAAQLFDFVTNPSQSRRARL